MSETHAQLIDTILEHLVTILQKMRRSAAHSWFQLDLSIAQVRVLFVLTQQHSATMSSIAEELGVGLPTASHLVEKLVRSGLAERSEDPKDRRHTLVQLTKAGEDLMGHLSQNRLAQIHLWLSQLNEEELTALQTGLAALSRVATMTQMDQDTHPIQS
ncbi:MAG TPA: MarR family transcriptional regulator [Ktedonobacteraceae bacterium]|jgi:DNA-binding MarR family transcriptional regulator